jgi:hypothetical protein
MASLSSLVAEQQAYGIQLRAKQKLKHLPVGPLFWQVEYFPTLAQAEAAVGAKPLSLPKLWGKLCSLRLVPWAFGGAAEER